MTKYHCVREAFYRFMRCSKEAFCQIVRASLLLQQELMRTTLSEFMNSNQLISQQKKQGVSFSQEGVIHSKDFLQPTDIERHKAQQILKKMGWGD